MRPADPDAGVNSTEIEINLCEVFGVKALADLEENGMPDLMKAIGYAMEARYMYDRMVAAKPSVAKGSIKAAKSDKALRSEYKTLLKKSPKDGPANLGIGQIMLRQGSAKEASIYLGRAVAAMPKDANAMFALGSSIPISTTTPFCVIR